MLKSVRIVQFMISFTLHFLACYSANPVQNYVMSGFINDSQTVIPAINETLNTNFDSANNESNEIMNIIIEKEDTLKVFEKQCNFTSGKHLEKIFEKIQPPFESKKYVLNSIDFDPQVFTSRNAYEMALFNDKSRIKVKHQIKASFEKFICSQHSLLHSYYFGDFEYSDSNLLELAQIKENFRKFVDYLIDRHYDANEWYNNENSFVYHINCNNAFNIQRENLAVRLFQDFCRTQTLNPIDGSVYIAYQKCSDLNEDQVTLKQKKSPNFYQCLTEIKLATGEKNEKILADFFKCRDTEPLLYNIYEYYQIYLRSLQTDFSAFNLFEEEMNNILQNKNNKSDHRENQNEQVEEADLLLIKNSGKNLELQVGEGETTENLVASSPDASIIENTEKNEEIQNVKSEISETPNIINSEEKIENTNTFVVENTQTTENKSEIVQEDCLLTEIDLIIEEGQSLSILKKQEENFSTDLRSKRSANKSEPEKVKNSPYKIRIKTVKEKKNKSGHFF
ncbi:hypothetical protein EDEG_02329 [Edhazardia aedis USNM 41457]|uniref:RGS domain-containing protein n=1 Tax=Edhazardia aedis (strain USNM 41457) TaxID=1003232 RepID=J9D697_EDHAE|nr:hypothetical protein EDEG_02329 [Edhazardia aedis USNM 41457]|eukprot:EJW03321.1 hypothetical protein EDEG_02329 [Edhazardia aedis USNM 41457]